MSERIEVPGVDVVGLRAANPGPFTLSGTNSWIVGRDPAWLIDPGPDLPSHRAALVAELERRGGLGGTALTHDHHDHAEGVPALRAVFPAAPLAAARPGPQDHHGRHGRPGPRDQPTPPAPDGPLAPDGPSGAEVRLGDGDRFGPLLALATPGHAPDHLAYLAGSVVFSGDAVLGEGSVFVAPDPGALVGYLDGLRRVRARAPAVLCPGHGPLVTDPTAKLDEYLAHRLDRERRLLAALAAGGRSVEDLLDAAWSEVPTALRPAAAVTLAAHLDKLAAEGRLPADVERPEIPPLHGVG